MDRKWDPKTGIPEDRRDHTTQLYYTQKLNRILSVSLITLVGVVLALSILGWQMFSNQALNQYLNCVNLAAIGVDADQCTPYQAYIEMNTNAYKRWQQRLNDKTPEDQQRRETK